MVRARRAREALKRKCHDAIAARGAAAIIPPRKNAKPWKPDTAGAVAHNEMLRTKARRSNHLVTMERLSPPKPRRDMSRARKRSGGSFSRRLDALMHCVKLLGQRLSAHEFDRQVAEFQVLAAVLNSLTASGTPITEVAG